MGMDQNFHSRTEEDYSDESLSYHSPISPERSKSFSRRRRDYKSHHLRKSLQPRRGHAQVEISRDLSYYKNKRNHSSGDPSYSRSDIKHDNQRSTVHDIKVTRTSKFARKGVSNRKRVIRIRRKRG